MIQEHINLRSLKGRTAFFLIHGVGEQNPFETVDYSVQNFIKYFEQQNMPVIAEHLVAKRRRANGSIWTESFVRLSSKDSEQDWLIDLHEYYWANQTSHQISVPEVLQWTEQTLEGTIKFYSLEENKSQLDELLQVSDEKHLFKFRLRWLTIFLRLFNFVFPVLRLLLWLILSLLNPFMSGRFLQSAWKLSQSLITPQLVNLVGDVAIYTTTDVKSPHEKVRDQMLCESLALLKAILRDKEVNYDQVILIGHSLGSCIAYDTLNRLCIEASLLKDKGKSLCLDKITGLISFGSPLDKIAFFCKEQAQKHQYIRASILEHLNSFCVKPQSAKTTPYFTINPVDCKLEKIQWVNYFHQKDPISGHLDYYDNVDNFPMKYDARWGIEAHMGYWTDPNFYEDIARRFLYASNEHSVNQELVNKFDSSKGSEQLIDA
ncbi:hypothetical protein [Brasilonema sp. UFV-L1]|uniref:hypothetical protein n=1 Tax=Brasilonema sp. UFV-L1 TaxID=2234130 RepID=UPI00145FCFB2|nr:hypothetical protein [Brasilonema sp. UFV-L1]NMG08791.1 hypothetical protein [Brasilonema sp. UFV-L1]